VVVAELHARGFLDLFTVQVVNTHTHTHNTTTHHISYHSNPFQVAAAAAAATMIYDESAR